LLALLAAVQLVELSVPTFEDATWSPLAASVAAPAACAGAPPPCAPEREAPVFDPSDDAPMLRAVAKARHLPAPAPLAVLCLILEAAPDTGSLGASQRGRPSEGLDVPACRSEQRWQLAHTTATSPA
jgi:hypothetical protein